MEISDFADRFAEERERLGHSRVSYARALGLSEEGLRKIENGKSICRADVLANAASMGADVQYILTGVRSNNTEDVSKSIGYEESIKIDNVIGIGYIKNNNGTIQINPRNITKAVTKPNDEHISTDQRAELIRLVDDIVTTEAKLKKSPKSHRSVWSALNAHCKVNTYTLIASSDFDKAKKYLYQWLGRLNSAGSAPVKDGDNWRKRHYAYIKINTKDPADADAVASYLARKFKAESLTELSNDELEAVYKYVAGRRNKRR